MTTNPTAVVPVRLLKWEPTERPYLLTIRAGEGADYMSWFDFDAPRNWDLLLHYYQEPGFGVDGRAEMVAYGELSKYTSMHRINQRRPGTLRNYRAIAMFDDDLQLPMGDVDRMFDVMAEFDLMLAQPALTHNSPHTYKITLSCPSFRLRFTNYVETMMPVFSAEAFATCVDSFVMSKSSWGIDYLWSHLLGQPQDRIAVIDEIQVRHTRPIDHKGGAFYARLKALGVDPFEELDRIMTGYDLQREMTVHGLVKGAKGEAGKKVRFVED